MQQTSPCFHLFEYRLCAAAKLIDDVPMYDVPSEFAALSLSSYVTAVHTVCETYLEDLGKFAVDESYRKFRVGNGLPHIFWCLILNVGNGVKINTKNIYGPRSLYSSLYDAYTIAKEKYISDVDSINGVKTKDQRSIFGPIGFHLDEVDHVLSQVFNSLGEYRGQHAHRFGIQHRRVKAGWISEIERLRRLTLAFDQYVCRLIDIEFK